MKKFLLSIFLALSLPTLFTSAQAQFNHYPLQIIDGDNQSDVIELEAPNIDAADLDGDGDVDIVVSIFINYLEEHLFLYKNDGTGEFPEKILIAELGGQSDISIADLDNDNDLDLIFITRSNGDKIGYFENDGSGNFSEEIIISNQTIASISVTISDINQDGYSDILFTGSDSGTVAIFVLINDGSGNFQDPIVKEHVGSTGVPLVVSDINDNGLLDVLVYTPSTGCSFYEFSENGTLTEPVLLFQSVSIGALTSDLVCSDLDGDGDIDVLLSSWSDSYEPRYYLNLGNGQFSEHIYLFEWLRLVTYKRSMFALDMDGDGDQDILSLTARGYGVYRNLGEGNFSSESIFFVGSPYELRGVPADINGDGALDLVFTEIDRSDVFAKINMSATTPVAAFDTSYCATYLTNTSVAFFPNSTVEWDFGNGIQSNELSPAVSSESFEELGNYNVKLTVCNDLACDEVTHTITVDHLSNFEIPSLGTVHEELHFVDSSIGFTNWSWIFGDGAVSTEQVVNHSYSSPGTYTVELFLTDSTVTGCTRHYSQEIVIGYPADITTPDYDLASIFPNPCSELCKIRTHQEGQWTLKLFNSLGQEVQLEKFTGKEFLFRLDDKLNSGIYFLELSSGNKIRLSERLLIQKP